MRLLLDTHTLLWFYGGDEVLSDDLTEMIQNPATTCFISIASLWEITIKVSLGKLELNTSLSDLFDFVERNQFWVMPIEFNHLLELQRLPNYHKDSRSDVSG